MCETPLVDADGRAIAPLVARGTNVKAQRDLAGIGSLALTGLSMIASGFLGGLGGSVGIVASIAGSAVAGGTAWVVLRKRHPNDLIASRLARARAVAPPGARWVDDAPHCIAHGRVELLRSVVPTGEAPAAAYRKRTVLPGHKADTVMPYEVPGDLEERHVGGRFAVMGHGDVAIVDDDWLLVVARDEDVELVRETAQLVVSAGATVTVVGPATRTHADDAGRFVAAHGYRDAGKALVFDGRKGAPVVVILER